MWRLFPAALAGCGHRVSVTPQAAGAGPWQWARLRAGLLLPAPLPVLCLQHKEGAALLRSFSRPAPFFPCPLLHCLINFDQSLPHQLVLCSGTKPGLVLVVTLCVHRGWINPCSLHVNLHLWRPLTPSHLRGQGPSEQHYNSQGT